MNVLAKTVGSPKVVEKHKHGMINAQRRIWAFACDMRPPGMGRHGRFLRSSATELHWLETLQYRRCTHIHRTAMKPFLRDEIGATTDEIADWEENQQGVRDRYRNDAYYGNKNRCKISVGEGNKNLYKTSNFGERKDRHGFLVSQGRGRVNKWRKIG